MEEQLVCEGDVLERSCYMSQQDTGIFDAVAGVRIISSMLGLLGTASIILLALVKRLVFSPEVHPIFMLSLADTMLSILWIAGGGLWLADPDSYNNVWCYAITLMTVILVCVAINLTLVYAIFAFISTVRTDVLTHSIQRVLSFKFVSLVYAIAWIFPIVAVMLVFGITQGAIKFLQNVDNCTCWCLPTVINVIPLARSASNGTYEFNQRQHKLLFGLNGYLISNYVIVFVALLILYFKILRRIKNIRKEHDQTVFGQNYGTAEATRIMYGQSQARKRVVLFLTVFIISGLFNLVLAIILIAFLSPRLNETSRHLRDPHKEKHSSHFQVLYIFLFAQSLTLPLQGFMNAIAYGWTRDDFVQVISIQLNVDPSVDLTYPKDTVPQDELEISGDKQFDKTLSISMESEVDD